MVKLRLVPTELACTAPTATVGNTEPCTSEDPNSFIKPRKLGFFFRTDCWKQSGAREGRIRNKRRRRRSSCCGDCSQLLLESG
ncbi:hypothetical protein CKAN_00900300 [Cinnamomum micranthum f. kanehirae]|uniref:Uncharacterized protein n=1 Tax=Cinnamomum micranthum f. kanehirae TaxID=337451 RepID=A0A3S3Q6Q4_9MAGN|nr:hypothetical protein CKAN_00900300 [Cinnamomum micranthum f. kanehirae]